MSENSEFMSQNSLIKRETEKGTFMQENFEIKILRGFGVRDKRRLSDPTQPFMRFGLKLEGENPPHKLRFKTVTDKYDQSSLFFYNLKVN